MQSLDALRNINISETLIKCGLIKDPTDNKQFKGDGFRISVNCQQWYDHNSEKGGGGSIDLAIVLLDCDFKSAIEFLNNGYSVTPNKPENKKQIIEASIIPTEHAENWHKTRAYLINERGINSSLVDWCYDMQLIYSDRYSNAVFSYGTGVELRGIYKKFKGSRGRLSRPFCILYCKKKPAGLALVESAIDCLSYRQLKTNFYVASIAGNSNDKIMLQCIDIAKRYSVSIYSCFDNDNGGEIAHNKIIKLCEKAGVNVYRDTPVKKDWNEVLKSYISFPQ